MGPEKACWLLWNFSRTDLQVLYYADIDYLTSAEGWIVPIVLWDDQVADIEFVTIEPKSENELEEARIICTLLIDCIQGAQPMTKIYLTLIYILYLWLIIS